MTDDEDYFLTNWSEDKVRIWSDEHKQWWRPDAAGYSSEITGAGFYTPEDAEQKTRGKPDKLLVIKPVAESTDLVDVLKRSYEELVEIEVFRTRVREGMPITKSLSGLHLKLAFLQKFGVIEKDEAAGEWVLKQAPPYEIRQKQPASGLCTKCGRKGTVLRFVSESETDNLYCICCNYPSISSDGLVYPPDHKRPITVPEKMYNDAPVMSEDFRLRLKELARAEYDLNMIKKGLGLS